MFIFLSQGVAQPIQGFAQRLPPLLVPAGVTAGVAATVASPAFNAVYTTPGTAFENLHAMDGGMLFQIFPEVRELGELVRFDVIEGGGQCHLAEAVMMAVGLAIGGDMHQLRPRPHVLREAGHDSLGKSFSVAQEIFEGHRARNRAIEESMRSPPTSFQERPPILVSRLACRGARIVNLMPASASISRVSKSAAVSGSHMPSGNR